MEELGITLSTLGALFLLGFVTDGLGRRTRLPRVTLLLIFGLAIGPLGLDLLPDTSTDWFPMIADMALVMVGFLLGGKLTIATLRKYGKHVFCISIAVVVVTSIVMSLGLAALGVPLAITLLLAGIAPATAPAATTDVVNECHADGPLTRSLLGIVAVDDAWGLVAFSVMLSIVQATDGNVVVEVLVGGGRELVGAVLVGIVLGLPMAYLSGRIEPGEPTLAEALGMVFLCGGIAIWAEVSFLLAAMVMGFVVANLAQHHERPFHAIEDVDWPFMILFFVLAGATMDVESLPLVGSLGAAYIVLRVLGRLLGVWVGSVISQAPRTLRRWLGLALMPQAGVALGMALVAAQRFEKEGEVILPVVITGTIFFELLGPVMTRYALNRAGEAGKS